jgi:hypothetical protein
MFWGIRWFTYVPYPKHFSTVACKYQISGIFYFRCVESGELLFALHGIKSDAMGCDGFSKKFILILLPVIFPFILHLINFFITSSIFPEQWKISIIRPIITKANSNLINDFHPISLLCFLSKVMELLLKQQTVEHFNKYDFLCPDQSGF